VPIPDPSPERQEPISEPEISKIPIDESTRLGSQNPLGLEEPPVKSVSPVPIPEPEVECIFSTLDFQIVRFSILDVPPALEDPVPIPEPADDVIL
jgi:hypothetical protein